MSTHDKAQKLIDDIEASRKPEAAPPVKAFDTSREPVKNGAVSLHVEAAPSDTDWLVKELRTAAKFSTLAPNNADRMRRAAEVIESLSRTSQPVQVEVTDDERERLAGLVEVAVQDRATVERHGSPSRAAVETILAALGGGDHAE